jgi:hypothetical protein
MVNDTARSSTKLGHLPDTCIDLIFCNISLQFLKARSMPVGWTDHNIVTITMNTKVQKKPPRIVVKINFKTFYHELLQNNLAAVPWELMGADLSRG